MENAYNTNDPQTLLQLKRLESDALLDVLRTINHEDLKIGQLCLIARNVLRAQLGVKKMIFYYEGESVWIEGMRLGFVEFSDAARASVMRLKTLTEIEQEKHPLLFSLGVEYVLPITHRGDINAYFVIADFADSEVEAQGDLIFIETLGNILSVAIRNKQLFKEKMSKELLLRELAVAETIQKQLLISNFTRFKEIDVYGINIAHHRIGGDFYDIIKKGKGTTFVCIADVAGKGIGAALLMSNLQANLRALCAQYTDLESIITELNKILYNIATGEKFVTLFLAKINTLEREVKYVNAGHNYPIYLHNNAFQYLESGCILLGIMPELELKEASFRYQPGDLLFMYTDGLTEQQNESDEMFGNERIIEELRLAQFKKSQQITEHMMQVMRSYANGAEILDDITMLSVKFLE